MEKKIKNVYNIIKSYCHLISNNNYVQAYSTLTHINIQDFREEKYDTHR